MGINRRQIFKNTIASLFGLALARLGAKAAYSHESNSFDTIIYELSQKNEQSNFIEFKTISSDLSTKLFRDVLYPNSSFRLYYDYFINEGFNLAIESIVFSEFTDPSGKIFAIAVLTGNKTFGSDFISQQSVNIPVLIEGGEVFVMQVPTSIIDTRPYQIQALGFFELSKNNTINAILFDRKLLKELSVEQIAQQIKNSGLFDEMDSPNIDLDVSEREINNILDASLNRFSRLLKKHHVQNEETEKNLFQKWNFSLISLGSSFKNQNEKFSYLDNLYASSKLTRIDSVLSIPKDQIIAFPPALIIPVAIILIPVIIIAPILPLIIPVFHRR